MMAAFAGDIRTRLAGGNSVDNGSDPAGMTDRAGKAPFANMLFNHVVGVAAQTGGLIDMNIGMRRRMIGDNAGMTPLTILIAAAGSSTGGNHRRHRRLTQPGAVISMTGLATAVQGINSRRTTGSMATGAVNGQTGGHSMIVGLVGVVASQMTSQTVPAADVPFGQADQCPIAGRMTGGAGVVDHVVQGGNGDPGGGTLGAAVAAGAGAAVIHRHLAGMIGVDMTDEIGAMATVAVPCRRHGRGLAVGTSQHVGIGGMTGRAGIMDLVVTGVHRHIAGKTRRGGVATGTIGSPRNPGEMIDLVTGEV